MFVIVVGDASLTRVDAGLQCGQTDWIRRTQRTTPTLKLGPDCSCWRGSVYTRLGPVRSSDTVAKEDPDPHRSSEITETSLFSFVLPSKSRSASDVRSAWPAGTVRGEEGAV